VIQSDLIVLNAPIQNVLILENRNGQTLENQNDVIQNVLNEESQNDVTWNHVILIYGIQNALNLDWK